MRSALDAWLGLALGLGLAGSGGPAAAQGPAPPAPAALAPTAAQVQAVVAALRSDPNLGSTYTVRRLHWVTVNTPPPAAAPPWLVGLFEFLSQAGSLLVWIVGAIALALACLRLAQFRTPRTAPAAGVPAPRPPHVGTLDIRPDSLPADIGAAALALVEAGRTRDALALLYRGALSRAVHRFDVRIEDSFTEGEALRAMNTRLDRTRAVYVGDLIRTWQGTVYGGHVAAHEPLAALCTRFAAALDAGEAASRGP